MNRKTSLLIGAGLLTIAVCFLFYAAIHPEASFPWSNRITFMSYGVYIWLLLKFLVDIPFLSNKRKAHSRSNLISAIGYFCKVSCFFLPLLTILLRIDNAGVQHPFTPELQCLNCNRNLLQFLLYEDKVPYLVF